MAKNLMVQVAGGAVKPIKRAATVQDLREDLDLGADYTATVNGEPEGDDYDLEDKDFVTFAPKVRGGLN